MTRKQELEQKNRKRYEQTLNNTVEAIISDGERHGMTYTEFDKLRIRAFHDERNFNDIELTKELERIQKLEEASKDKGTK